MPVLQQVGFDGATGSTKTVAIAASTAASTLIVVTAGASIPAGVPTDNQGNTWPAAIIGPLPTLSLTVYLLQNCPAGINSVTVHEGFAQGWIIEESGLLSSSLDQKASQQSGGTTNTSGNTGILAQANEVCYGFFAHATTTNFTAGSGWDSSAFTNYGGTGGAGYTAGNQGNVIEGQRTFVERQVVTSTAALAATATLGVSATVDAAIITFMQGSAGPPSTPLQGQSGFASPW